MELYLFASRKKKWMKNKTSRITESYTVCVCILHTIVFCGILNWKMKETLNLDGCVSVLYGIDNIK